MPRKKSAPVSVRKVEGTVTELVPAGAEPRDVTVVQQAGLPSVDFGSLVQQAMDQKVPVETLERLLAMIREQRAEWARGRYFDALAKFQAACPTIRKDRPVYEKDRGPDTHHPDGPKVRYYFAPLDSIVEQVKGPLGEHGFSYRLEPDQSVVGYFTARMHVYHRDGHHETTTLTIPVDTNQSMSAPQRIGSSRTFALRYAFQDALGIVTGDGDDDAAPDQDRPPGPIPESPPAPAAAPAPATEKRQATKAAPPEKPKADPKRQPLIDAMIGHLASPLFKDDRAEWAKKIRDTSTDALAALQAEVRITLEGRQREAKARADRARLEELKKSGQPEGTSGPAQGEGGPAITMEDGK